MVGNRVGEIAKSCERIRFQSHFGRDWCPTSFNPRGWTDSELAVEWLTEGFDPATKETTASDPDFEPPYRLLILDGHDSHVTWQFFMACHEQRILPLCLPPHTIHLLQPLDVAIFGPLQKAYGGVLVSR